MLKHEDFTELELQRGCDLFVNKEVYLMVNPMVTYILEKGFEDSEAPFCFDDIVNLYPLFEEKEEEGTCSHCGKEYVPLNEESLCEGCFNGAQEPQEIFTWYAVSDWLCELLEEKGKPVIPSENLWGRTSYGQAISMDAVIREIFLETQPYWILKELGKVE